MKWRKLTLTKKFLIIGIIIGILASIHYSLVDCRASAGGPVGECESEWELSIAVIEYNIFMISYIITLGWIFLWPLNIFGIGLYPVIVIFSFILFFGLTGLILGFISEKLKRLYNKRYRGSALEF